LRGIVCDIGHQQKVENGYISISNCTWGLVVNLLYDFEQDSATLSKEAAETE
jgi:hypothetical protein